MRVEISKSASWVYRHIRNKLLWNSLVFFLVMEQCNKYETVLSADMNTFSDSYVISVFLSQNSSKSYYMNFERRHLIEEKQKYSGVEHVIAIIVLDIELLTSCQLCYFGYAYMSTHACQHSQMLLPSFSYADHKFSL